MLAWRTTSMPATDCLKLETQRAAAGLLMRQLQRASLQHLL
jgi:hypothetical protein